MKSQLFPAFKLSLLCLLLFVVVYPLIMLGFAQFAPNQGKVQFLEHKGRIVGAANIGQNFTQDYYFNTRPSAVAYNAASSGGSNKAPSNPEYLSQVQARIDTFLVHNPTVKRHEIPAELITASGSGLDPHLSLAGAMVQIDRIAKTRAITKEKLVKLVNNQLEKPLLGMFGTEKINVLKLNIALDDLK